MHRGSSVHVPSSYWTVVSLLASDWSMTNLTHGHVVTAKSADHQTRLPWIGLRAVASKAWTRDQPSAVPASSTAFVVGNLLASSVPVISVALSSPTSSLHSLVDMDRY